MTASRCFAQADTPRAVLALAVPPAALAYVIFMLWSKSYSPLDYFALLQTGELSWFRQGVGWIACIIWIVRYYPAGWSALLDGPCLIHGNDAEITLPGNRRVRRTDIRAVRLERSLLRKAVLFETPNGDVSLPLIFVRPSSDDALRGLASIK